MANPNIAAATSILGYALNTTLTTSSAIVVQQNLTDTVYKINSIVACNTGASAITVTVGASMPSTIRFIAKEIAVPANTTLVVLSKETSFYLRESCEIHALASANSTCDLTISYEIIS